MEIVNQTILYGVKHLFSDKAKPHLIRGGAESHGSFRDSRAAKV